MRVQAAFAVALALALTGAPVNATSTGAAIVPVSGLVTASAGQSAAGALVFAFPRPSGEILRTRTDSQGAYRFKALPVGTYSIVVLCPGTDFLAKTRIIVSAEGPRLVSPIHCREE